MYLVFVVVVGKPYIPTGLSRHSRAARASKYPLVSPSVRRVRMFVLAKNSSLVCLTSYKICLC